MADKHQLLKRYWGYDTFRPLQEDIVDSVVEGHDTLALLPTGGGKSLCYQLPGLMMEGVCVVVSPLISLMKDQVQRLQSMHIRARYLVSGMTKTDQSTVLASAVSGTLKFLYVSPERLRQQMFIEHFRHMKVSLIAVDEAHCISQWGYDFRPTYLQIATIRQYHPNVPLIALTATAIPDVVDDICRQLLMHNERRFQSSFERKNLIYSVQQGANKMVSLIRMAAESEGSGIVYVGSRRMTSVVATQLAGAGIPATSYHAGLDMRERDKRQEMWMAGVYKVMVATNAFGMGIDKQDVRFVVHYDIPSSLEAYFQEAGRAGRDGNEARAVMLYDEGDDARLAISFDSSFPSVKYIRNIYRALCNYYQLPMGFGADSAYDFDMEAICAEYNLKASEFYSACRFLEREGLISIPDKDDAYSTLYIPLHREELYHFQLTHEMLGNVLQAAVRLYPGLFTAVTPIDEQKIARRCFMEPSEVMGKLRQMSDMKVAEYNPRPLRPQIVFAVPRVDERDILFSEQNYEMVKQAARRRLDAVLSYLHCDDRCRCRQLLDYFGEDMPHDCGLCDVCLKNAAATKDVVAAIKERLGRMKMPVGELCSSLEREGYSGVGDAVRDMLDDGTVQIDGNFFLSVS